MAILQLIRFNDGPDLPSPVAGMFGTLTLPSGRNLYTCERPWVGNKTSVSCIPDGVYKLKKRKSNVVSRTTGGDYTEGWEVTAVPGRTFIMLHPGNWPDDLEGCIAPGLSYGLLRHRTHGDLRLAVGSSRDAFDILMGELDNGEEEHELHILPQFREYP